MNNVYAISSNGETDWVAGRTNMDALSAWFQDNGLEWWDIGAEDEITEVRHGEWDKIKVIDEDEPEKNMTILDWMKKWPDHRGMIASTAYLSRYNEE